MRTAATARPSSARRSDTALVRELVEQAHVIVVPDVGVLLKALLHELLQRSLLLLVGIVERILQSTM